MPQHGEFPISDPTPDLSPTARRILEAGARVLDRDGITGLTFEQIARESGENGALIRYHFGSKAGLVSALVDYVLYAQASRIIELLSHLPPGRERRQALLCRQREVSGQRDRFRQVFDLIPTLIRDPVLHPKLRDVLRWYMAFDAWALGAEDPGETEGTNLSPLSMLTCALIYGIALQVQADPELDVKPAFDLWERFVTQYLEDLRGEQGSTE